MNCSLGNTGTMDQMLRFILGRLDVRNSRPASLAARGHFRPKCQPHFLFHVAWSKHGKGKAVLDSEEWSNLKVDSDTSRFTTKLKEGYEKVAKELSRELRSESVALGILYCRKLLLLLMVTLGRDFDINYIFPPRGIDVESEELTIARNIWSVLDTCVSLRSAGWVGEAGAMAVAAEALGLGISSAQTRQASSEMRAGILPTGQTDDSASFPSAGISQVLSSVLLGDTLIENTTGSSLAACSEASIGSSGLLVFLKPSLQTLLSISPVVQDMLLAVVSRSVRLLAVVDYSGEDSSLDASPEVRDLLFSTCHSMVVIDCAYELCTFYCSIRVKIWMKVSMDLHDHAVSTQRTKQRQTNLTRVWHFSSLAYC